MPHRNSRITDATKVWTTLITNTAYLPGLLTLEYSLRRVGSKYPLIALYTDSFPAEGHAALDARRILKQHVSYLQPAVHKDFANDVRFYDCWTKLTPFSLVEFKRVVQLDCDMMVLRNMDELMDLELDSPNLAGTGNRIFAATHACVCNPLGKSHYPENWIPANCAYSSQHVDTHAAQRAAAPSTAGLAIPNGGLQVMNPSLATYAKIVAQLASPAVSTYDFADQSLLGDVFHGRWVPLPYVYNALKTMRWKGVHDTIWQDGQVKNIHYILSPKPWDRRDELKKDPDPTHDWWWECSHARWKEETQRGVCDGF